MAHVHPDRLFAAAQRKLANAQQQGGDAEAVLLKQVVGALKSHQCEQVGVGDGGVVRVAWVWARPSCGPLGERHGHPPIPDRHALTQALVSHTTAHPPVLPRRSWAWPWP